MLFNASLAVNCVAIILGFFPASDHLKMERWLRSSSGSQVPDRQTCERAGASAARDADGGR